VNENDLGMEVNIELRPVAELNVSAVLDEINRIAQSNRSFSNQGIMRITTTTVIMPEGRGKQVEENRSVWDMNHCLITPNNRNGFHKSVPIAMRIVDKNGRVKTDEDNTFCGVYALEIGMRHRMWQTVKTEDYKKKYKHAREQDSRAFAERIDYIMDECKLDLSERGMIREDWAKVQDTYKLFRFVVYEGKKEENVIFEGRPTNPHFGTVHICLIDGHYSYCTTSKSLFGYKYECDICGVRFTTANGHSCTKPCYRCAHTDCEAKTEDKATISCRKCRGSFKNEKCYENHLKVGIKATQSKCTLYKKCLKCGHMHLRLKEHVCGTFRCFSCLKMCPREHQCYIQKSKKKPERVAAKIARTFVTAYDTEATQCRRMENGRYMHELNVICSRTLCHVCWDKKGIESCEECGVRAMTWTKFDNPEANLASEFLTWAKEKGRGDKPSTKRRENRIHILIAHYAQGYDSQFLVAEGATDANWTFNTLINRGRKILCCKLKREGVTIVLLDFYNYVAKSLTSLCKAFDLDSNLAKGSFPHHFNSPENWNYSAAAMPPKENWTPEAMTVAAREKFLKWWEESDKELKSTGREWNFQEEIIRYCQMDTAILQQALVKFYNEMKKLGVHPLHENFTLASFCLQVYINKFMPKDSIGIFCFCILIKVIKNCYKFCLRSGPSKWLQVAR